MDKYHLGKSRIEDERVFVFPERPITNAPQKVPLAH